MATWRSLDEAAKRLKVSRRTLQRWAREGHIRIYKRPGDRKRYVDLDEVEAFRQYQPLEPKKPNEVE
jgi:excisionase family DNA binding protein